MSNESTSIDVNDLRERYLHGTAEATLAEQLGIPRRVVRRQLLALGIQPRNRQQAMKVRMANSTPEQRSAWASAAQAAVRGMTRTEDELIRRAVTNQQSQRYVGAGEELMQRWLQDRDFYSTPQLACGQYNIDLALGNTAVEIHANPSCPERLARTRKRSEYLLGLGWNVLYVWISGKHILTERAAHETVTFLNLVQTLPPGAREYRVVRGTGEFVRSISFNPDEVAVIPAPDRRPRSRT